MIGNRRLGIGSGAEASSFSFTHPASTGQIYTFRIATSTGFFIRVDSANRQIPTTGSQTSDITTLAASPVYASYQTNGNGATSCTVFSTDINGKKSGTITQLEFENIGYTLLAAGALDISKCAKSLTFLSIVGQTNISSVTGLSSCTALKELRVNGCGFTSLDCTPLTELVTVLANDQSSLTAFTAGPKLKSLTIFKCPQLRTAAFFLSAANNTLEFLDCHECPNLGDLQLGYGSVTTNPLLMNLANLKVLDVSNTNQQSSLSFWPVASKTTLQSVTATGLGYISSLSLVYGYNTAAPWTALTSLNLSGSTLQNDPWRIPTTVTTLNLTNIAFGETAEIGIDMTGCTLLRGELGSVLSIAYATVATTNTTTTVRQLILDGSGFDTINIDQGNLLYDPVLLTLSAQGMPYLTSFTLGNTAWLKTILITGNPKLTNVSITGTTNRISSDIYVDISRNPLVKTLTLSGSWSGQIANLNISGLGITGYSADANKRITKSFGCSGNTSLVKLDLHYALGGANTLKSFYMDSNPVLNFVNLANIFKSTYPMSQGEYIYLANCPSLTICKYSAPGAVGMNGTGLWLPSNTSPVKAFKPYVLDLRGCGLTLGGLSAAYSGLSGSAMTTIVAGWPQSGFSNMILHQGGTGAYPAPAVKSIFIAGNPGATSSIPVFNAIQAAAGYTANNTTQWPNFA